MKRSNLGSSKQGQLEATTQCPYLFFQVCGRLLKEQFWLPTRQKAGQLVAFSSFEIRGLGLYGQDIDTGMGLPRGGGGLKPTAAWGLRDT